MCGVSLLNAEGHWHRRSLHTDMFGVTDHWNIENTDTDITCGNRLRESNELRENMETIIEAHAAILLVG